MYDLELSAKGVTVKLNAAFVGKDLLVWLTGGQAHIGAVALAVPRPSLRDDDKVSADATVMTVGGHKEDLLARKIALALATKLNVQVCVSAGLHWDAATPTKIEAAKELSGRLTKTLLMHITKDKDGKTMPPDEPAEPKAAIVTDNDLETIKPVSEAPAPETPRPAVPQQARPAAKPAPRPAPAATRPAQAGARPVAARPPGTVTRDAQGRPVSVRQAVNATLKKPLLNK